MEDLKKSNDVLGDLYALRAGLSVISQKADELTSVQNREYDAMLESIDGKEDFVEAMKGGYISKGKNYYDHVNLDESVKFDAHYNNEEVFEWVMRSHGYDEYDDETCDQYEELTRKNNCRDAIENDEYRFKAKKTFVQWLHSDEFERIFNHYKKNVADDKKYYQEFAARRNVNIAKRCIVDTFFAIGALVALVFLIINIIDRHIGLSVLCGISAIVACVLIWYINKFIRIYKPHLSYKNTNLDALNEFKNFSAYVCEQDKPIIDEIKNETDVLYKSLQKAFNKTLDSRDWKHLDLIIYYIETGRAETIKEALQLLEREMQTKRIIGAIQEATECICSAVESMADRISAQLNVISGQLSQIASLQQVQIAQNSELISQSRMQNALIAKSNVTSEQLMQDVQYIKNYGVSIR